MAKANRGDLSKIRRILSGLDQMLDVVNDDGLKQTSFKEDQALRDALYRAWIAAANISAELGDANPYFTQPDPHHSSKSEQGDYDGDESEGKATTLTAE